MQTTTSLLSLALAANILTAEPTSALNLATAKSLLGVVDDDAHTTKASWNGRQVVFVDYVTGEGDDVVRHLGAIQEVAPGQLQPIRVTEAGVDPTVAEVTAIGFSNADRDAAKELVVILNWPIQIYDVGGNFYEVRVFDDAKLGQQKLVELEKLSKHFGTECDCQWRDGKVKHFRFKTVAAVRRELRRLGY